MTIVKVYKATDFSLLMDGQEVYQSKWNLKRKSTFGEREYSARTIYN